MPIVDRIVAAVQAFGRFRTPAACRQIAVVERERNHRIVSLLKFRCALEGHRPIRLRPCRGAPHTRATVIRWFRSRSTTGYSPSRLRREKKFAWRSPFSRYLS